LREGHECEKKISLELRLPRKIDHYIFSLRKSCCQDVSSNVMSKILCIPIFNGVKVTILCVNEPIKNAYYAKTL